MTEANSPVVVNVNLDIRSMGPVDEMSEVYSLDCYFRQSWQDKRLSYNTKGLDQLALNWAFLAKIWVPDTFFVNGKQSFLHKITVPNRYELLFSLDISVVLQFSSFWSDSVLVVRW